MTNTSSGRIAVGLLGALALCGSLAAGAGASEATPLVPSGTATFTDPAGDAQGGPDVTRVVVDGDSAAGRVAITVTAPGFEPAAQDDRERDVVVWLDTDRSAQTGDPTDGAEYGLEAWNDASGRWWDMIRWNGTGWESVPETPTMRVTSQGSSVTFTVGTTDLGGATRFRFYVFAGTWNAATKSFDTRDEAPDFGYWTYDIAAAPPTRPTPPAKSKVLIGTAKATPASPHAGKQVSVSFLIQLEETKTIGVIDIETGEISERLATLIQPLKNGRYTARITVGGATLHRTGAVRNGDLRLRLVVPKTAAGKLLRIAVKVTATQKETGKTLSAMRTVSYRVKGGGVGS